MLFSKSKKIQRDRNAGLVFRWRGGYRLNRGGSTIAFLLTSIVFAASFVLLNLYAKENTVPSRYRAEMIQLGNLDDELTWWIERNSPDLPAWSESKDELSDARVEAQLVEILREQNNEAYVYEDVEMQEIEIGNEGLYTLNNQWLPPVTRFKPAAVDPVDPLIEVDWKLKVEMSDELAARRPLRPEALEYKSWIKETWRGRSVRLIVVVDARGKVLSVNPTEWSQSSTVKKLENWVFTIPFEPADKDQQEVMTGVITLSYLPIINPEIKAKNEIKEELP